jgi:hypothetical protein
MVTPAADARLIQRWTICGTLVGQDRPAGGLLGIQTVFYAWLLADAASPGDFALVIRGTGDLREWFLDFEGGELAPHSVAGKVECGFWSIFSSMRYRPAIGGIELPAIAGITQAVGSGRLLVTGHSMGSVLAIYTSFDLAAPAFLGDRVETVVFASPRPGDEVFAAAFGQRVPNHRAYFWEYDIVPRVPFGFGYSPVPNSIELAPPAGLHVCTTPMCSHHSLTYAAMLDPSALEAFQAYPQDLPFLKCLSSAAAT